MCILLPPKSKLRPTAAQFSSICAAFATCGNVHVHQVRRLVDQSVIEEWGKMKHVDSEEGDTIRSATLSNVRDDSREASFVRVRGLTKSFSLCSLYTPTVTHLVRDADRHL